MSLPTAAMHSCVCVCACANAQALASCEHACMPQLKLRVLPARRSRGYVVAFLRLAKSRAFSLCMPQPGLRDPFARRSCGYVMTCGFGCELLHCDQQ